MQLVLDGKTEDGGRKTGLRGWMGLPEWRGSRLVCGTDDRPTAHGTGGSQGGPGRMCFWRGDAYLLVGQFYADEALPDGVGSVGF